MRGTERSRWCARSLAHIHSRCTSATSTVKDAFDILIERTGWFENSDVEESIDLTWRGATNCSFRTVFYFLISFDLFHRQCGTKNVLNSLAFCRSVCNRHQIKTSLFGGSKTIPSGLFVFEEVSQFNVEKSFFISIGSRKLKMNEHRARKCFCLMKPCD